MRDDVVIGVIALWKERVEPFTPAQIELVTTFSSQASIAIENARFFSETKEALDHQKASAEMLHVISSSVADARPVFEKILESCERLFEGRHAQICLVGEDGGVHLRAYHGPSRAEFERLFPVPLSRESGSGVAILERRVVHYPDVLGAGVPEYMRRGAMIAGNKSVIVAPMLWEDRGIGAVVVGRDTVGEFSEREIALLKTFADQAVIAIENVRLFNETKEALDQQKASAEILEVISSSVADTQPVFYKILESCERVFAGRNVGINLVGEDGAVHLAAFHGPEDFKRHFPIPLTEESGSGSAILQRSVMHYPDVEAPGVPDYARRGSKLAGIRSVLIAPMLWEGRGIGSIFVGRDAAGEFSEKEIALLRTFADQAVIAIQNARLFQELQAKNRELTEALEQQTATAEILKVISSSPTDVQPVFDAIVRSGVHLFQGVSVTLRLVNGDRIERAAFAVGPGSDVADDFTIRPFALDDRSFTGRAVVRREVIHAPDVFAEDWVGEASRQSFERMGVRAAASAPLLRESKALGAILVMRAKPAQFSDKELALLRTFADQAVIAIENVRLFNELQVRNRELTESLEQQTATAEILKVISSSPTDIQPVLDTVASTAARLCDALDGVILRIDGDVLRLVAQLWVTPVTGGWRGIPRQPGLHWWKSRARPAIDPRS